MQDRRLGHPVPQSGTGQDRQSARRRALPLVGVHGAGGVAADPLLRQHGAGGWHGGDAVARGGGDAAQDRREEAAITAPGGLARRTPLTHLCARSNGRAFFICFDGWYGKG